MRRRPALYVFFPIDNRDMCAAALAEFVARHEKKGCKQRTPDWYALMAETLGGSDMAPLLGRAAYGKSVKTLAMDKIAPVPFPDVLACHLGSMFEDVVARVVEIDTGTTVVGDSICVRAFPGHRNSPDGYAVMSFYWEDGWILWTTDCGREPERSFIVLWEIKSPLSRVPDGCVPELYRPQIHSGLAVSPLAATGLFIDAMFRKCALDRLGTDPDYDQEFHRGPAPPDSVFAYGLVAVYAATGDESVASAVQYMRKRCLLLEDAIEVLDFGDCPFDVFRTTMRFIDKKMFRTAHADPFFADGRGNRDTIGVAIDKLSEEVPPGFFLLGFIPWKLFSLRYTFENMPDGFREDLEERIEEFFTLVEDARGEADPKGYLDMVLASPRNRKKTRSPSPPPSTLNDLYG